MTSLAAAAPDPASDLRIDPQIRAFLAEINKDSSPFWELPQPKPQEILTGAAVADRRRHVRRHDDRADHHPGWSHREAVHHEARRM